MSDEEYGRAWAKQQGYVPQKYEDGSGYCWGLHLSCLPVLIPTNQPESEAYAALGRAVREVHRQVPRLEGEQLITILCWVGRHRWSMPGGYCEDCGKCDKFFGGHEHCGKTCQDWKNVKRLT